MQLGCVQIYHTLTGILCVVVTFPVFHRRRKITCRTPSHLLMC